MCYQYGQNLIIMVMCAFPGLRKTSPEALGSLKSVSALLVLDICSYSPIVKERLYLPLGLSLRAQVFLAFSV